ncbi:MAG: anthranilate phosphoribosyltransferase [Saprospiraceae bacterium]|jgi:anthranilate phosphoribosyltransferase|nr:anthranilate phosphoribosyltransferase [Saprospiraceae bacterium]MBP6447766.1 anthranilate phosphoribosyltransferase [Saprospiraceae bacterium]
MKQVLNQLFEHQKLTRDQAKEVLINISQDKYNASQLAAFISVYLMRNISVEELSGFRDALLDLCIPVDFEDLPIIDLCGTGGDGKNTFNISTIASFVVAGAGYHVAKHGNYGVSSVSGSSNVLEHFGFKFTNDQDLLHRQMEKANICFLHAPLFHPALKSVGPIRRELGVKTFFNMLGPLVNPARPQYQSVGVFSLKLARLYQFMFENSEKHYCIVHSVDGYDEVSLTGSVKLITNGSEQLIDPTYFGMKKYTQKDIDGGNSIDEAAQIFSNVLLNKGTSAQNNVVLANAALGIQCFDQSKSIAECASEAKESLLSGSSLASFKKLISTVQ